MYLTNCSRLGHHVACEGAIGMQRHLDVRQSIGWKWLSSEWIDAGSMEGVPRLIVGLRDIKCIVKICVVGSDEDPTARRRGTHHIKGVGPMAAYSPLDTIKFILLWGKGKRLEVEISGSQSKHVRRAYWDNKNFQVSSSPPAKQSAHFNRPQVSGEDSRFPVEVETGCYSTRLCVKIIQPKILPGYTH